MSDETLAAVLLAFASMLGAITVAYWPLFTNLSTTRRTRSSRPAPDTSPSVPEIPPLDPMVLCPECRLLGYHSLDEIPPVSNPIRTFDTPDGDTFEVNVWGGGLRGYWRRQCCFCDHVWSVPLEPKETA